MMTFVVGCQSRISAATLPEKKPWFSGGQTEHKGQAGTSWLLQRRTHEQTGLSHYVSFIKSMKENMIYTTVPTMTLISDNGALESR
jgi:hypothetical protein